MNEQEFTLTPEQDSIQTVISELNAAVFEWNHKTGKFYSTAAYQKYAVSQVRNEDILHNSGPTDLVHPDDQAQLLAFFQGRESGDNRVEVVLRIKLVSGEYHWCRMIGFFYKDADGSTERTVGVIIDINEEREQNFMLDNLLNGIPGGVGVFTFGDKLKCTYLSDVFVKMTGYTRSEIETLLRAGKLMKSYIAPADYDKTTAAIRRCSSEGKRINLTYRYVQRSGEMRWVHLNATKMREDHGEPVYYCMFGPLSEETALYRSIVEESSTGIYVAERNTRRVLFMNEALGKLFHAPLDQMKGRINRFEGVSEKYLFFTDQELQELREDQFVERHIVWENNRYLRAKARALKWNGIDAYIIYFEDETAERQHQRELQQFIDRVPTGIGVFEIKDSRLSLSYVNDAYYEMLGTSRENRFQFYGKDTLQAIHPDDLGKTQSLIEQIARGEDQPSLLLRISDVNRKWIWMNLTISVIERKQGYVKLYAAFANCNEMMQVQQELQSNHARLQAAIENVNVFEWKYDFIHKIVTDSGSLGELYHWPKVIENVPEVLNKLERTGQIHPDSVDDFRWLYEHCGDGKQIKRNLRYKSADGSKYIWLSIVYSPLVGPSGEMTEVIGTATDVTEQKEREQNYEEQLRLKKTIARGALVTASCNLTKNTVLEYDSTSVELKELLTDVSVNEMLGKVREQVLSDDEHDLFLPIWNCKTLIEAFENGTSHIELQHHIKESSLWVESSFDMIENPYTGDIEMMAVIRDITEAVRAKLVVERLLAVDYDAILMLDVKTGTTRPLQQSEPITLIQELVGMQSETGDPCDATEAFFRKYVIEKERDAVIQEHERSHIMAQLEENSVFESLYTLKIDEKIYRKRDMYAYLDGSKNVILCAIQDVTNTYEQEELQKQKLSQALRAAQEANKSKTAFLTRISHDMRTPMNGILGLAELSAQESDSAILKKNISQIKESGIYLLGLINDTLDFQQAESGKLYLNPQIVYTAAEIRSIYEMISPAAKAKGVKFHIENGNADTQWYIRIDPVRVKRILVNILSNAVKFTPFGGTVTMKIENLSRDGMVSHNCIRIIDTGIGMSEDFVKYHLFKPFEQENTAVSTQYIGSGLGLSIVHALVEAMDGRIEVESVVGKGTTFSVYLDFERVEEEDARAELERKHAAQSGKTASAMKLAGKHILLVEDHPMNAKIAIKVLEKVGCIIDWAKDGAEGVQLLSNSAVGQYDAILMDIRMPVMNGLEATREIRSLKRADARSVPIIAVTANTYQSDIDECIAAGMNAHLGKPYEIEDLYDELTSQIEHRIGT